MNDSEYLYIFVHVPKTAGTSLRESIKREFPSEQVLLLYPDTIDCPAGEDSLKKYVLELGSKKNKIKIIFGHKVFYGIHHLFNKKARYVTLFRHPVARAVSHYNYFRTEYSLGKLKRPEMITQDNVVVTPEDFFASDRATNAHLRFLNSRGFGESAEEIVSKFYFIGLTENSQADFSVISKLLNARLPVFKINSSKKYLKTPTDEHRALILKNNSADLALYEKAKVKNFKFKEKYNFGFTVKNNMPLYYRFLRFKYIFYEFLRKNFKLYRTIRKFFK